MGVSLSTVFAVCLRVPLCSEAVSFPESLVICSCCRGVLTQCEVHARTGGDPADQVRPNVLQDEITLSRPLTLFPRPPPCLDTTSTTFPATTSFVSHLCSRLFETVDAVERGALTRSSPRTSVSPPRRLLAPHEPASPHRDRLPHRREYR